MARQPTPHEQDRDFGHFTIGASLGRPAGPIAAGGLIGGPALTRTGAPALAAAGAGAAVALTSLSRIARGRRRPADRWLRDQFHRSAVSTGGRGAEISSRVFPTPATIR
ncbi:hypothetical protein GCM10009601_07560 [Streptomyces thermospinosisporus]|uniref:MFS transporter n=1 Tax=Streptomyces thermospinosisporus TaxID=161482 RepID=A0ABN1YLY8_9ACTN